MLGMADRFTAANRDPGHVERFRPTSGYWLGWIGIVGLVGAAVLTVSTTGSVSLGVVATAVGLCWGALLVWLTMVRPAVRAEREHLLIRNILRDTEVPWHLIDDAVVRHTLRVYAGDEVHHGLAMSRTTRQMLREGGGGSQRSVLSFMGSAKLEELNTQPTLEGTYQSSMNYADFVEIRIAELVTKRKGESRGREAVTRRLALVEAALLGALTLTTVVLIVVAAA